MLDSLLNKITFSDAFAFLTRVPDSSVDATITSPPGWNKKRQLDPGHKLASLEMGQEGSPEAYLAGMMEVFGQVARVTKPGGSLWLHVADTRITDAMLKKGHETVNGYYPGELMDMPSRLAREVRRQGFRFVSEVVWSKTNANHFAATTRPSDSHEKILVFHKPGREMYFDWFAAQEERADGPKWAPELRKARTVWTHATESVNGQRLTASEHDDERGYLERDAACEVHGDGSDGALPLFGIGHTMHCSCKPVPKETVQATPSLLVARCISSATSERGNCGHCGTPYERIVKKIDRTPNAKTRTMIEMSAGFTPSCKCHQSQAVGDPTRPLILDPFAGSGTTLLMASSLGRDFIGSELDPRFVAKIAPARIEAGSQKK